MIIEKLNVLIMIIIVIIIIIIELKMMIEKLKMKIECIDVIVRLVSITPGHVKLDWLPPPKVDRVNNNPSHYQH